MFGVVPRSSSTAPASSPLYTVYVLTARVSEGIRDGYIVHDHDNDYEAYAGKLGAPVARLTEAVALFVDPLVSRTKKSDMPSDAIPLIRWFERYRRPGPFRFQEIVPKLSSDQSSNR